MSATVMSPDGDGPIERMESSNQLTDLGGERIAFVDREIVRSMAILGGCAGLLIAIVLGLLSWLVGIPFWIGVLVGFAAGGAMAWWLRRSAGGRVMGRLVAVDADPLPMARFENLAEGLALSIGIPEPELLVLDDTARNGLAVDDGVRATLAVTKGLLEDLDQMEMEGVVAALLVRLKTGDARAATLAAGMIGIPLIDSAVGPVCRPLSTLLLARLVPAERDVHLDRQAVAVTRYPPGLLAALERMAPHSKPAMLCSSGTSHLWLAPPEQVDLIVPPTPLEWRIDILQEI